MADLSYRPWSVEYKASLERLYAQDTTWGDVTAQIWRDFVVEAPLGPPIGSVTIDEASGDVIGQFVFLPMRVTINGMEVPAFRPQTPIVGQHFRGALSLLSGTNHPVSRMYLRAMDDLRAIGGVLYMLPDPRWARFLRGFTRFQLGKFPLFSRPLPLGPSVALDSGFEAGALTAWDERVDELWRRFAIHQPVGVTRNAAMLRWKIGRGDWDVLQVEQRGRLVGVVASRHKGDQQWLIGDLLAEDTGTALRNTVAAAVALGDRRSREAPPDKPIKKVAILATPSMEPAVRSLEFSRDRYDFLLAVESLDATISPASIAPDLWYVSAND